MSNEVIELNVTKTSTYYMTVQLDESISLEDIDQFNEEIYELFRQETFNGEDTFESDYEEESGGSSECILGLNESGKPFFLEDEKEK